MEEFLTQIKNVFSNAGINILFGIVIIVVGLIICKLIKVVLRKILRRGKRDEAMTVFVVSLVDVILKIIVMITALATMGVNTASIIAVVGTCGVAIGLALKDSLGNLASGILIIFNKPFKKDDYVSVNGVEGKITAINLFTTTLVTYDNTTVIVPNSQAINNAVVNFDGCAFRRIVIDVEVAKGTDIRTVKDLLYDVVEKEPLVTKEVDSSVILDSQTLDCVKLKLRAYASNDVYWDATYSLTESVYEALRQNGLLAPDRKVAVRFCENEKDGAYCALPVAERKESAVKERERFVGMPGESDSDGDD